MVKVSAPTLFSKVNLTQRGKAAEAMPGPTVGGVEARSCMEQLYDFLDQPDADAWRNAALAVGFGMLALRQPLDITAVHTIKNQLEGAPKRSKYPALPFASAVPSLFSAHRISEWAQLLATIDNKSASTTRFGNLRFLVRLFDEKEARKNEEFEDSWRAFFQAWNLLQFHRLGTEVVSSEWLVAEGVVEERAPEALSPTQRRRSTRETPVVTDEPVPTLPVSFLTLLDDFPEAETLLRVLHTRNLSPPAELEGIGDGAIEVEAILGWPDQKIAVCLEIGDDDRRVWDRHGWNAFMVDDVNMIADAVADAGSSEGRK